MSKQTPIPDRGEFTVVSDRLCNANFNYNGETFENYVVMDYSPDDASSQELLVTKINGTAFCIPALGNGKIAFQCSSVFLKEFVSGEVKSDFVKSDLVVKDGLRIIFRDIGVAAISCKEKGLDVDLSRVLLSEKGNLQVKSIPVKLSSPCFDTWKKKLIQFYKEIVLICYSHHGKNEIEDSGFLSFINELTDSQNCEDMKLVFCSEYFWTTSIKDHVISQFKDFVEKNSGKFYKVCSKLHFHQCLLQWRSLVAKDARIGNVFQGKHKGSHRPEVDDFLVQLQACTAHFNKVVNTNATRGFTSFDEFLEYMDKNFWSIMQMVYKGSVAVEDSGCWFFEIPSAVKSPNLDKDTIDRVISELLDVHESSSAAASHSSYRFIDAFIIPKFRYDSIRNSFG